MVRQFSVILGIGLIVLWIAGLSSPFAPAWIAWLDGAVGLLAFLVAGSNQQPMVVPARNRAAGPIGLSLGLFAVWAVALSTAVVPWMTWWTFAFACSFLALGIIAGSNRRTQLRGYEEPPIVEETENPFKKSA